MTRSKAIKAYCFDCSGNNYKEVRECEFADCPLYAGRQGKRPKGYQPKKQIRYYCVNDCMNGSANEVKLCGEVNCPLWIYRMGKVTERPE